jgi:hypothetical protein
MTELTRKFGNHEPGDLNVVGLEKAADAIRLFIRRDTVVADEGIGEDEDLALVRRVSERLRVSDHSGVEDDFSSDGTLPSEGLAEAGEAVFED